MNWSKKKYSDMYVFYSPSRYIKIVMYKESKSKQYVYDIYKQTTHNKLVYDLYERGLFGGRNKLLEYIQKYVIKNLEKRFKNKI